VEAFWCEKRSGFLIGEVAMHRTWVIFPSKSGRPFYLLTALTAISELTSAPCFNNLNQLPWI